jgi:hypothetical protein
LRLALIVVSAVALAACAHKPAASKRAPGPGAIAGLVRAADTGAGIEGARVVLRRPGSVAPVHGDSDASGAYYISGLPPGRYVVTAYAAESKIGEQAVDVGNDRVTSLDFAAGARDAAAIQLNTPSAAPLWRYRPVGADPRSGTIEGTVADLRQARLPATVVSVIKNGTIEAELVVTDDRGRYTVENLAPGVYTVVASYAVITRAQIEVRRQVEVTGGEVVVVPLWLETDTLTN